MSSDDRDPGVLTPDMISGHLRTVDVADLEVWSGPYDGDVGAAHTFLATFGQLQLPLVLDGKVLLGQEFVSAERADGQFGGQMTVLDLTDLGWAPEKAIAAALGLHQLEARSTPDREHLASLLMEIRDANEDWLIGAGWDSDDLDDLVAMAAPPPSFEELEKKYGAYEDEDGWATVTIKAPQHVCAQWNEWAKGHASEAEAFEALLDGRVTMPTLDADELVDEGAEPPPDDL